jgi:histidinol-phosphate aminotransferase
MGFEVLPSSANFVFARHSQYNAERLFLALRQHNIIVRHFDKPRVRDFLRISIGTDAEMNTLLSALKEVMSR